MIWTNKQISEALSVPTPTEKTYGKLQFNSQNIEQGDLFIALKGQRDGHDFVQDALIKGASAAIISRVIPGIPLEQLIKVDDCFDALQKLSQYKRQKSKAKFIAVTGSVGKTSSKEALRIMLAQYGNVHTTYGNFNNALGVSLTLASMPHDTDYAIIEMGMNAPGEIRKLTNQVKPDIAIITNIGTGHIEFFPSIKEIADAKCEIFEGLDPRTGIAIINLDNSTNQQVIDILDALTIDNIKTFGTNPNADIKFVQYEILNDDNVKLTYQIPHTSSHASSIEIVMDIIPPHLAFNFAASFATIIALNLNITNAKNAISRFQPIAGRGKLVHSRDQNKSYSIICDYYNSNPESLRASLEYLTQFKHNNKIAIIGDMGELGDKSDQLHESMIPYIEGTDIKKLFLIGSSMQKLSNKFSRKFQDHTILYSYQNIEQSITSIDQYLVGDELILIKGSRIMQLEKCAQYLGVNNAL